MARFDNFAHQLQRITVSDSVANLFAIESDCMLVATGAQNAIAATIDKDVSARIQFAQLAAPNSALIPSPAARDWLPIPLGTMTFEVGFGVNSVQVGGTLQAATDHMRGPVQASSHLSYIDNTTSPAPIILLPIGSAYVVSSIVAAIAYAQNFTSVNQIFGHAAYVVRSGSATAGAATANVLHSLVI